MKEGDPGVIHLVEFRMGRPKCEGDAKEGGGVDESIVGHVLRFWKGSNRREGKGACDGVEGVGESSVLGGGGGVNGCRTNEGDGGLNMCHMTEERQVKGWIGMILVRGGETHLG